MYCPADLHDDYSTALTLEQLQRYWISIYEKSKHKNLKYKISFTGGEVTVNKNFRPFVQWLKNEYSQNIFQLLCTTNGSASTAYYLQLFQYMDNISFSFHSEHANEQEFFNTVIQLSQSIPPNKFIHVNIMDEYWNKERIARYTDLLTQKNISHSVNKIDYSKATRSTVVFKGQQNLEPRQL